MPTDVPLDTILDGSGVKYYSKRTRKLTSLEKKLETAREEFQAARKAAGHPEPPKIKPGYGSAPPGSTKSAGAGANGGPNLAMDAEERKRQAEADMAARLARAQDQLTAHIESVVAKWGPDFLDRLIAAASAAAPTTLRGAGAAAAPHQLRLTVGSTAATQPAVLAASGQLPGSTGDSAAASTASPAASTAAAAAAAYKPGSRMAAHAHSGSATSTATASAAATAAAQAAGLLRQGGLISRRAARHMATTSELTTSTAANARSYHAADAIGGAGASGAEGAADGGRVSAAGSGSYFDAPTSAGTPRGTACGALPGVGAGGNMAGGGGTSSGGSTSRDSSAAHQRAGDQGVAHHGSGHGHSHGHGHLGRKKKGPVIMEMGPDGNLHVAKPRGASPAQPHPASAGTAAGAGAGVQTMISEGHERRRHEKGGRQRRRSSAAGDGKDTDGQVAAGGGGISETYAGELWVGVDDEEEVQVAQGPAHAGRSRHGTESGSHPRTSGSGHVSRGIVTGLRRLSEVAEEVGDTTARAGAMAPASAGSRALALGSRPAPATMHGRGFSGPGAASQPHAPPGEAEGADATGAPGGLRGLSRHYKVAAEVGRWNPAAPGALRPGYGTHADYTAGTYNPELMDRVYEARQQAALTGGAAPASPSGLMASLELPGAAERAAAAAAEAAAGISSILNPVSRAITDAAAAFPGSEKVYRLVTDVTANARLLREAERAITPLEFRNRSRRGVILAL
eukprot:XP_001695389.1 predicted protein [Chlamydomonas reinhardtii]